MVKKKCMMRGEKENWRSIVLEKVKGGKQVKMYSQGWRSGRIGVAEKKKDSTPDWVNEPKFYSWPIQNFSIISLGRYSILFENYLFSLLVLMVSKTYLQDNVR